MRYLMPRGLILKSDSREKDMLTASLVMIASCSMGQSNFNYIRLGDIDGMGFRTGTDPCGTELCWPFNSPFDQPPACPLDGSCSNYVLLNAAGQPINVDGVGILTQGDFLPDLDCSVPGCDYGNYGTHYNSDEFDNREAIEVNGLTYGNYLELSGANNTASEGSGWTDVAVSGTGLGWNNCFDAPVAGSYICGQNQPIFIFDFTVANADPNQPVYINAVFGDYDVDSAADTVLIRTANGQTQNIAITTQNNAGGQDGMIQMATAAVPFASVFTNWPTSPVGYLEVEFQIPDEPFVAYDYVEIGITPLVEPEGCCCFRDPDGNWLHAEMTSDKCADVMGYYQGDGIPCEGETPVMGACCIQAAGGWWVCEYTADCECDYQGGTFYPGTPCNKVQCEPPPNEEGCCCYEDPASGIWYLTQTTSGQCEMLGGIYAGDGVPCEGDVSPIGACCVESPNGLYCFETSECYCLSEEINGTFYAGMNCSNPEIDCEQTKPGYGACCYIDQKTGCPECIYTTEEDCRESGNYPMPVWNGVGTSCSDPGLDCCQPFGACCIGNSCVWTIERTCIKGGGTWTAYAMCHQVNCPSCPEDVNNDGSVDINDLLSIINNWGTCP
ncbi:MAG: hypothetical protein CMJ39_06925 [Phycisphaerae bacterium]|nr:hypothetical protein [Phycisphaerae bacterium]